MRIVVGRIRSQTTSRCIQTWKAYVQRRVWLRGFMRHSMNAKLTAAFNTLTAAVSRRKHYVSCIGKGIQCVQAACTARWLRLKLRAFRLWSVSARQSRGMERILARWTTTCHTTTGKLALRAWRDCARMRGRRRRLVFRITSRRRMNSMRRGISAWIQFVRLSEEVMFEKNRQELLQFGVAQVSQAKVQEAVG